ncbi:MAG: hypothetical protein KIT08_01250 [Anaerolineales bacterium]|nr:MAG: hypothetical protein KIT08_01250 [Anaerolineales bacterium]
MANGETFDEMRKMAESGTDIPVKSMLRLVMAGIADMHDADNAYRQETTDRLRKIEDVTKYPSALWFVVNRTWKTLGVFAFIGLFMALVFMPEARAWALESIAKIILGWL